MQANNNVEEQQIDIVSMLEDFFKTVKKFWIVFAAITVVITVLYSGFTYMQYEPYYQAQATFSVNSESSSLVSGGSMGSEQVKESLPYILQSNVMKNLVKDELELSYFPAQMSLDVKENVNMFILNVTAQDPETATNVMHSVVNNISQASVYVLGKISVEILDVVSASSNPANYLNLKMNIAAGFIGGLFVCCLIAFAYTVTSKKIKREEDFKKSLSITCISTVPQITFKKRRKQFDKHIHIYNDKVGFGFLESMRTIRTRVEREANKLHAKVIMVTSSIPGEGKSTIAANLAMSLAEKGRKVILVDMDLRNPSIVKVLGKEELTGKGTADALKKSSSMTEVIQRIDDWHLSVMIGGKPVSDPSKVLNVSSIKKLVEALKAQYDYVILDTPPAAMLVDASVIASCADCAVYVVKQDYARTSQIAEGLDALSTSRTPVIGAILNGFEKSIGSYSYGSYKYARYGSYSHYGSYGAYGAYSGKEEDAGEFVEVER